MSNPIMEENNSTTPTELKASTITTEVSSKRKKPYKSTSDVWDHFTKELKPDGSKPDHCTCNYCKKVLGCSTANGTTSLHRHLGKCKKYMHNKDPKQQLICFSSMGGDTLVNWKFDQESCCRALARMIVLDELPISFVERGGFRDFCKALQPKFTCISRTTLTKDCLELFMSEQKKLKEVFGQCARVCLTTDLWTSIQNLGYMYLTAHYIDCEWKLQKRIINFRVIPTPHTGEVIANTIESCLLSWGLDNLFTLTVDNASSNDTAIRSLKRKFNKKNGLIQEGEFFHIRCSAHILNLIVRDGLEDAKNSITRIRNSVRYIRSSPSRMQIFKKCCEAERIASKKSLSLDVCTRWNSTYLMLESAIVFQKAFERYEEQDFNFVNEVKDAPPTEEDWRLAKVSCKFLETFYDATKRFSGSNYVTSNVYFHEVISIEHQISGWVKNEDLHFCDIAKRMKAKFDKYWGNIDKINLLLVIAVVLDPCYKLGYVRFSYSQLFDSDKVNEIVDKIKGTMERLFQQYKEFDSSPSSKVLPDSNEKDVDMNSGENQSQLLKQKYRQAWKTKEYNSGKSELERYLDDALEDETPGFDLLKWWKTNSSKYQVLSQMARDTLAIPVSTVASESAFSTSGRVLDQFRSSLTPKLVECLICTQDWLRTSSPLIQIEEKLEELEEIESGIYDEVGATTTFETSGSNCVNVLIL